MSRFGLPWEFGQERAAAALVLLAVALAGLACCRRWVRGTTLMAPWTWAVVSCAVVAGCEAAIGWSARDAQASWVEPLRFAAAVSTFCPLMAVLGAKRPQDRAWQAIVLSLWGLLAIPSAEVLLLRAGEPLYVAPAWSWLMAVLMLVGLLDYLPTRYWSSCLLACAAQGIMLSAHLPLVPYSAGPDGPLIGLACLAAGIWLAVARSGAGRRARAPIDRVWLDFRDTFGAFWGLRVAERIRASSTRLGWNVTLTWNGVSTVGDEREIPAETSEAIWNALRSLLRRFVSPEWIAQRLGES